MSGFLTQAHRQKSDHTNSYQWNTNIGSTLPGNWIHFLVSLEIIGANKVLDTVLLCSMTLQPIKLLQEKKFHWFSSVLLHLSLDSQGPYLSLWRPPPPSWSACYPAGPSPFPWLHFSSSVSSTWKKPRFQFQGPAGKISLSRSLLGCWQPWWMGFDAYWEDKKNNFLEMRQIQVPSQESIDFGQLFLIHIFGY